MYMVIGFRRREGVRGYRVQGLHYLHESRVIHVNLTVRTVCRGFHISGVWNRGVPLYTEVSSFQGVGIEEFHCKKRCLHFRGLK